MMALTSSSAMSEIEIKSIYSDDSVVVELSKACVADWVEEQGAKGKTGTLIIRYIGDYFDSFHVQATAMLDRYTPSGERYSDIRHFNIDCHVTGEEQVVINYRQRYKEGKKRQDPYKRELNSNCLKGSENSSSNYICAPTK